MHRVLAALGGALAFVVLSTAVATFSNSFSFSKTLLIMFSSNSALNAARPAAQLTGWPPKVLIWPRTGA